MPAGKRRRLELRGRTALITGGGSGIGAAVARALSRSGVSVVVVDLHQAQLDDVVSGLARGAFGVAADVTDPTAMSRAVATAVDRYGSVDVCIANAGIAARAPTTIAKTSIEEFERIVEVDLFGVWRTVRACLPEISRVSGHVVVTSSVYAFINGAANAPYALSKAAVESFGRSLRAELAGTGATAGVLYPGWVDTPIIKASHESGSASRDLIDTLMPRALRAAVSPDTVASAVVRGVENRSARIVVPRRWAPVSLARGVVNAATDTVIDRRARVHDLLRKL